MNYKKIQNYILNLIPENPKSAIIFGSGLSDGISSLEEKIYIPYKDIPGHPVSSVKGHPGQWVFGYCNKKPIICANGRFHYYEGLLLEKTITTVLVINSLGCKKLLITNASGCLNQKWDIGDFMIAKGFIDYSFINSTKTPKIIKIKKQKKILNKIKTIAFNDKINIREGIYVWTTGPSYETSSEINNIIQLGGDAVGMSTVPELKKAIELGMDVSVISCLTNFGAGINKKLIEHDQVIKITKQNRSKFSKLITKII